MPRSLIDISNGDQDAAWQRTYAGDSDRVETTCPVAIRPSASGRGPSDAIAAWQRWHTTPPATLTTVAEQLCYGVLERARVETLASLDLPGIAHNLSDLYPLQPGNDFLATLYRLSRHAFAGNQGDYDAERIRFGEYRITSKQPHHSRWSFRRYLPDNATRQQATSAAELLPILDDTLPLARDTLADGERFAGAVSSLVTQLAGFIADDARMRLTLPTKPDDQAAIAIKHKTTDAEHAEVNAGTHDDHYRIFSRQWDEELPARTLYEDCDAALLNALETLDKRDARRLAHRLQRRIQAAGLRRWSFDLEEGVLDNRRLSRLLTGNTPARVFRQEQPSPLPEACVSLLVDQSGSMRGLPQQRVVQALDLLVHALESCRIPCEVLGFTTRFSDGENPLYQRWQEAGAPVNPGRLNALRHIIYKPMSQPWRRCRRYLALMLKPAIGKENIDGEALAWAATRLLRQPQPRKILLVLSDGAPYDSMTASANGRSLLENHLRTIINNLETSPIQLSAIGTSADVARFYQHALTLQNEASIAEALFQHIADVLLPGRPRHPG